MNITRKIERAKVELEFLIKGDGSLDEKQVAIDEINEFVANALLEQQTIEQTPAV